MNFNVGTDSHNHTTIPAPQNPPRAVPVLAVVSGNVRLALAVSPHVPAPRADAGAAQLPAALVSSSSFQGFRFLSVSHYGHPVLLFSNSLLSSCVCSVINPSWCVFRLRNSAVHWWSRFGPVTTSLLGTLLFYLPEHMNVTCNVFLHVLVFWFCYLRHFWIYLFISSSYRSVLHFACLVHLFRILCCWEPGFKKLFFSFILGHSYVNWETVRSFWDFQSFV